MEYFKSKNQENNTSQCWNSADQDCKASSYLKWSYVEGIISAIVAQLSVELSKETSEVLELSGACRHDSRAYLTVIGSMGASVERVVQT